MNQHGNADESFWKEGNLGKQTRLPARLLFAQVREDESIERSLWQCLEKPARAFIIASGGCTALSLAACGGGEFDAIDINPAQTAITELKLAAITQLDLERFRNACVSDARDAYTHLRAYLNEDTRTFFDSKRDILQHGFNRCGWIDRKLETLASLFHTFIQSRTHTKEFLKLGDVAAQKLAFDQHWNNWRWRLAMNIAFSKSLLSLGFGAQALRALPIEFPAIMKSRIEQALIAHPAATNPYLWQTFLDSYPENEEGLPFYLQTAGWNGARENAEHIHIRCDDAVHSLNDQPEHSIDFFAISNILEIVDEPYKIELLKQISRTSKAGAMVCVRSIFPQNKPIFEDPHGKLKHDPAVSHEMELRDRGLFCTFIQIFRA